MANHLPSPDEWQDPNVYFDSAMPGGVLYEAYTKLPLAFVNRNKEPVHAAVRSFLLQHADWALHGKDVPPQKEQFYHEFDLMKQMYSGSARRRGAPYFGPSGAVIVATLRPEGAKPLGPANDS